MRNIGNARWTLALLIGGLFGTPLKSQAQAAWPLAVDVAGGPSHGWGGKFGERSGGAVSVTITNAHDGAFTRAFTAGYSRIGGDGDECIIDFDVAASCLIDFPSTYHMGLLFGASHRVGAASVRGFLGPAAFFGETTPGIGPQAQADVSVGVPHVELVAGYRASVIFRGEGATQALGSWLFGLRFR